MALNISRLCWQLVRRSKYRVDLLLFCAPGAAGELCKQLNESWGFRIRSSSSVRTARAEGVRGCLQALEPEDGTLGQLLDRYAKLVAGLRRGARASENHMQGLQVVVRALLEYVSLGSGATR